MAYVTTNLWGVVLVLDHGDVEQLLAAGPRIGEIAGAILGPALAVAGVAAPVVAAVVAAVVGYFRLQTELIRAVDRGNGVYLTLPWPAIYLGQIWLIIPTTRPEIGLGDGWASIDQGRFRTEDGADLILYQVEHNAVAPEIVEFRLTIGENASGWAKEIILRDGGGSEWVIQAEGRGNSADNSLWAGQVQNGQSLTFRKPKGLGVWYSVVDIGHLEDLQPGDRATFVWAQD